MSVRDEENKVHYGLSNLTIFFKKDDRTWETGVTIPGIVSSNANPQVKSNDFYADNTLFWRGNSYTGDEITVSTAYFPKNMLARMLGWKLDNNGALVAVPDGNPEEFAMAWQVDGDQENRGKVAYCCTASVPSEKNNTTSESIDPTTEEITIRSKATVINGKKVIHTTLNEKDNAEAFATFFTNVYLPDFTTSSAPASAPSV